MMLSTKARLLFLAGVILVGLASLVPIWRIEIWAPQYPEGLVIQINTDSMQGNIDQINILNHYIGMKKIVPSEIPELKIIPKILYAFLAFGLLAVLLNRVAFARVWLGTFIAALIGGLYDFYTWGYDYGHDLNPNAPIQVQGLSYQPPLIGHKTLLNIQSYSIPDWGGYILLCALALLIVAVLWDKLAHSGGTDEKKKPNVRIDTCGGLARQIGAAVIAFLTISCTVRSEPIHTGADHCEACRMTIMDARFGGEVITAKGRIYKFDSIDCLLGYYGAHKSEVKQVLVSDFVHPGKLINASEAHFVTAAVNGPMGSKTVAAQDVQDAKRLSSNKSGASKWADLVNSSAK